jgi:type IV secretory pathway VirB10-like protein
MAPTHEPHQLLEPSNLLEPLDLTEHQADLIHPAARAEKGERSQRGSTRATGGVTRPTGGDRRSPVKSILMVAGALACFGAGTMFPQLQTLTRGNVEPGPPVASASRPSAPIADVATKSDESSPVEPKPPETKSATLSPNASSAGAAVNTTATGLETNAADRNAAAQPAQLAQPAPAAHDALAGCAPPCNQQPCPKDDANCLEGAPSPAKELTSTDGSAAKPAGAAQPVRQGATPQAADSERAETRASARQEERAQSSRRGKRAAQRAPCCRCCQPAKRRRRLGYQHRYLQTKFFTVVSGFSEFTELSWRSTFFSCAATLRSFFFGDLSAITIAQYVL